MNNAQKFEPTEHEIEVLRLLAGEPNRVGAWGAWVGACLEFLEDAGLCTPGPNYVITEAGRQALRQADSRRV